MRELLKRFWLGRRGTSMVELAIVLPVLLLLVAGLWEFGRIYDAYLIATNAAREGARWAAMGESLPNVQTRVTTYLQASNRLSVNDIQYNASSVTAPGACGTPGTPVEVDVPITVSFFMPGIFSFGGVNLGNSVSLTGRATMPIQRAC